MKKRRAVVIGAGISGSLAAIVLARHFDEVVLLEKDEDLTDANRRGTPQTQHVHVLLKKGEQTLESLIPGFSQRLRDGGSIVYDAAVGTKWLHLGHWKARGETGFIVHRQSRQLVERLVREEVQSSNRIHLREGVRASGLKESLGRITAVLAGDEQIEASLTVDATGRGSRVRDWLKTLGYPETPEQRVSIDLKYATRIYEMPKPRPDWYSLVVYPDPPKQFTGGVILPLENNRWIVTLLGYHGHHPSDDEAEFCQFAKTIPSPEFADWIGKATPSGPVRTLKFPYAYRRRFEHAELPQGLVMMGDSMCSFDPVFGQGMTMAITGVKVLDEHLSRSKVFDASAFLRDVSRKLDIPWKLAVTEDGRFRESKNADYFGIAFMHWFGRRIAFACRQDLVVYRRFMEVVHLIKPPTSLLAPNILCRIALRCVRPSYHPDEGIGDVEK